METKGSALRVHVAVRLLLLMLVPSTVALAQGQKPPTPVAIVSPLPLPVTGSVEITGTPTVTLSSPATVQVENPTDTPLLVQNVDEPGRQAHSVWVEFVMGPTSLCSFNCENITTFGWVAVMDVAVPVPDGKRWVITHISGRLPTAGPGAHVALQSSRVIALQQGLAGYFGPFFPLVDSNGTTIMQQFGGPIFVTIGPGEKAHLNVLAQQPNNYFSVVQLSGYLVDAGLGSGATVAGRSVGASTATQLVLPGSASGARIELEQK